MEEGQDKDEGDDGCTEEDDEAEGIDETAEHEGCTSE